MSDNDWLENMVQIEAQSTPECPKSIEELQSTETKFQIPWLGPVECRSGY